MPIKKIIKSVAYPKGKLQKQKDEYQRYLKGQRSNGKLSAKAMSFAQWKSNIHDKYEKKPVRKVKIKSAPKKKYTTAATKAKTRELKKNLSYKEIQRLRKPR